MKNSQVAHLWANQSQESAKTGNGNFSFRGRSLYSYNTEIARIIEGRIVYTTRHYSSTTSGKHQNQIPNAVKHLTSYAISYEMKEVADTWEDARSRIFENILAQFCGNLDQLKNKKTSIHFFIRCFLMTDACKLAHNDFKGLKITNPKIAKLIYALNRNINYNNENNLYYGLDFDHDHAYLLELFLDLGIDLKSKIEKEKQHAAKLEEKHREQQRKEILEQQEKIQEWRKGEFNGQLHNLPVMLRLRDQTIETSHGAIVPLNDAINAFSLLTHGHDLKGKQIGSFTVNEVSEDFIKIGCHTIPMSEVNTLFRKEH